ncbi:TPA: S24 family peptidase [Mannheimia haemolytica]|nr:S24 family peptidase [Mannheimia haemolytica]
MNISLSEAGKYILKLLPEKTEFTGNADGRVEIRKELLSKLGLVGKNCGFIVVDGEGMKPTIEGECELIIDLDDKGLKEGKIYLFSINKRTMVRRVQILLDRVILIADNPDYPNLEIIGKDLELLEVIGRVRYIGKLLN